MKINQLHTSVYPSQTNGPLERFNRTLKHILKKLMEVDGRNWDQLLPYLMFSIQEVPQRLTGYSPFDSPSTGDDPRGCWTCLKKPGSSNRHPIKPWWNMWGT